MFSLVTLLIIFKYSTATTIPFCDQIGNRLVCSQFKSFNQLDFTNINKQITSISIEPLIKLHLDSKLNLAPLKSNKIEQMILKNINSFDALHNPFILMNQTAFSLEIESSDWLFNEFNCSANLSNEVLLFESLNLNELRIKDPQFKSPICPLIFRNSLIKKLIIQSISPISFSEPSTTSDIDIQELYLNYGYTDFIQTLDTESILNQDLFNHLKLIEINQCYLKSIDATSILKLTELKELRLIGFNLKQLFNNGMDWLNALNTKSNDLFLLKFSINRINMLEYGDDEFCYFKNFPHNQSIIPLFYYLPIDFDYIQLDSLIPCSCTIYWFYRDNYKNITHVLQNTSDEKYFPAHCFNLDQLLIDEQFDYCQNGNRVKECAKQTIPQLLTTSPPIEISICDYCKCIFSSLNLLECSNESILTMPSDFNVNSTTEFNYVSLVGSSITSLNKNSFRNLRLKEKATIIVSNINDLDDDIFSPSLIYINKFTLNVYNSSLNSLYYKESFKNLNLSRLEFKNCLIPESILTSGFYGSYINVLSFIEPLPGSSSPFFKRAFSFKDEITVFKLEIKNAFNTFRLSNPDSKFGIDLMLLNDKMFKYLTELEIVNTFIDYIESSSLLFLEQLRIVRFENVNLKNIIQFYFNAFEFLADYETQSLNLEDESINWLANKRIERVYLGREEEFTYQDDYLCYFASLSDNKLVLIYDSIDYFVISNYKCTCTILLLYSKLDNLKQLLSDDYDARYIPDCVKVLNNSLNLRNQLHKCLNGSKPDEYCKYSQLTTSTMTTSEMTTEIQPTVQTTLRDETTAAINQIVPSILISLLVLSALIFILLSVAIVFYFKTKKSNKETNQVQLKELHRY